jgi:hypothetical protein
MPDVPDFFRDFGIIPYDVPRPAGPVRSYLSWGHVVGQYIGSGIMLGLGLGLGTLFALLMPLPVNILASAAVVACCGWLVYRATRNDCAWVELDGDVLRAKYLYTGRIIERSIEEIDDLLTLVYQLRTLETIVAEAWLGRVRGIQIRFRDKRTPLLISRADPAMRNARELIEAVVYRMSEKGGVDAEVVDFAGRPLIRRIYWKSP